MFLFRRYLFYSLGLSCLCLSVLKAKDLALEPSVPYSWWHTGEPVVFKSVDAGIPQGLVSLEGKIFDVDGNLVHTVSLDREDFEATGWVWESAGDGFYEIEFAWLDEAGIRTEVFEKYSRLVPNGKRGQFERKKYSVAVAVPLRSDTPTVGQFGFDGQTPKHIPIAKLVGFDLARLTVGWGAVFVKQEEGVEFVQGEQNWEPYDTAVEHLEANDIEIMAQITYTPLWASPHPEKTKVSVCVIDGTAYAPVNMDYFSKFVEDAATRYKDRIRIWEIWNEPAMPGGSIFWRDTPENYVRLLKAGYEAVKRVDPTAEVWNGGMGMRIAYYAFYDTILELGAGAYIDKLSLHGKFVDLLTYRNIEDKHAVPHKTAVVTEWHAILAGQGTTADMDTEPNLSMRMMRELFSQIKQGVVKSTLFSMVNQTETEAIPFALANQYITHSAGLFRRQPRVEPRHPAVVMASFMRMADRKATFDKEVLVGEEGYGIVMDTNEGKLMAIWSDRIPVAASEIKVFASANSTLRDWEGKVIALDQAVSLAPNKIYYLKSPDEVALATADSADRLLPPQREVKESFAAPEAEFVSVALAESRLEQNSNWMEEDWKYRSLKPEGVENEAFSAQSLVGLSKQGLYLVVKVRDVQHVQNQNDHWWNGDSLQFAIDCEGRGMLGGNVEFIAALKPEGLVFQKLVGVNTGADLPVDVSPANGSVLGGSFTVTREGETTIYRIQLPWNELYPMVYDPNRKLKLSILVNNNNGNGREAYLEWGGGIGSEKDPSQYGTLHPPRAK